MMNNITPSGLNNIGG